MKYGLKFAFAAVSTALLLSLTGCHFEFTDDTPDTPDVPDTPPVVVADVTITLSGSVSDVLGNAIAGVDIALGNIATAKTDAKGSYKIENIQNISGIAAGTYPVTATKDGYVDGIGEIAIGNISESQDLTKNFTLEEKVEVSEAEVVEMTTEQVDQLKEDTQVTATAQLAEDLNYEDAVAVDEAVQAAKSTLTLTSKNEEDGTVSETINVADLGVELKIDLKGADSKQKVQDAIDAAVKEAVNTAIEEATSNLSDLGNILTTSNSSNASAEDKAEAERKVKQVQAVLAIIPQDTPILNVDVETPKTIADEASDDTPADPEEAEVDLKVPEETKIKVDVKVDAAAYGELLDSIVTVTQKGSSAFEGNDTELKITVEPSQGAAAAETFTKALGNGTYGVMLSGNELRCNLLNAFRLALRKPINLTCRVSAQIPNSALSVCEYDGGWKALSTSSSSGSYYSRSGNQVIIYARKFTRYAIFMDVTVSFSAGTEALSFSPSSWGNLNTSTPLTPSTYSYKSGYQIMTETNTSSTVMGLLLQQYVQNYGRTYRTVSGTYNFTGNTTIPARTRVSISGTQSYNEISISSGSTVLRAREYGGTTITTNSEVTPQDHTGGGGGNS